MHRHFNFSESALRIQKYPTNIKVRFPA